MQDDKLMDLLDTLNVLGRVKYNLAVCFVVDYISARF